MTHQYAIRVNWTGNTGTGTSHYRAYERAHEISAPGKPAISGSSDPAFRGDAGRYNPEELLVASLSSCHMLWCLHLASEAGVVVTAYRDDAVGTMRETGDGGGAFSEVILRPVVTAQRGATAAVVSELHHRAHALC
ncbi:MAG: OsmC family protein, partial [Gemmatimonadaceae bacterium]